MLSNVDTPNISPMLRERHFSDFIKHSTAKRFFNASFFRSPAVSLWLASHYLIINVNLHARFRITIDNCKNVLLRSNKFQNQTIPDFSIPSFIRLVFLDFEEKTLCGLQLYDFLVTFYLLFIWISIQFSENTFLF